MSKTTSHRQCTLCKTVPGSSTVVVSFTPESFAKVGTVVKLKQSDNTWEDGWLIETVGTKVEEADLPDSHTAIKHHRKATGDALPKIPPEIGSPQSR